MIWVTILSSVLKFAGALTTLLRNKKLIDAGEDRAIRTGLEKSNEILSKVKAAKRTAIKQLRDPSKLREDDGHRRD